MAPRHRIAVSVVTIEEHTLLKRALRPDAVVLDLGANRGEFSLAMATRYGCACHAVEPNPAMASQIPEHPRVEVHRHAMGGEAGEATFHISTDPLGSSLHPTEALDYTETVTVQVETLPGLLGRLGLDRADVVKVDIEGAEIAMFEACSDDDLQRVDQFAVEFHEFNGTTPPEDVARTLDRFRDLGFAVYRKARFYHYDVLILHPGRLGVSAAELAWIRTGHHYLSGAARLLKKAVGR